MTLGVELCLHETLYEVGGPLELERTTLMLDIAPETNEVIDEIRRSVAALCEKFPGEYWREQDRERAYPTEFVKALTDAGFLAVLVPEEYGGSGLPISAAAAVLEEIHKSGCN